MDLVLVRHARPTRIEEADGPADPPLTELGVRQARAAAEWLSAETFDAVYSSPLRRALETAEAIAEACGLAVQIEPDIREYDAESNSYIPYEELKEARSPEWMALAEDRLTDLIQDGGAFQGRVVAAMERIIEAHPGQRVLAVCHGGCVNVYLAHILGMSRSLWLEAGYASISRVVASRRGPRSVASVNEMGHLRGIA
jgi:2,3-bisphosphoglycerate-dependent phosphoglycerate mutase